MLRYILYYLIILVICDQQGITDKLIKVDPIILCLITQVLEIAKESRNSTMHVGKSYKTFQLRQNLILRLRFRCQKYSLLRAEARYSKIPVMVGRAENNALLQTN